MILTKTVELKISNKVVNHYREKGYNCNINDTIIVKVDDLTPCCSTRVDVKCDYCSETTHIRYQDYNNKIIRYGNYYCKKCSSVRAKEVFLQKYGVSNPMKCIEIKQKAIDTMNSRTQEQLKEIQNKKKKTCMEHYGTEYALQSPKIREAMMATNRKRYGVNSAMQNPEIRERAKQSMINKYGAPYSSLVPEIKKKICESSYDSNGCKSSKQQRYINNLYKGELNGVIGNYNCDIVLRDEKLCVEYDGRGHELRVELGYCSKEQFDKHELIRDKQIKSEGYHIVRIISHKDYLPSDSALLSMLSFAKQFFVNNPERTWLSFDIDNSCIYNAYYKESEGGEPYDYGPLHKLKRSN